MAGRTSPCHSHNCPNRLFGEDACTFLGQFAAATLDSEHTSPSVSLSLVTERCSSSWNQLHLHEAYGRILTGLQLANLTATLVLPS
jgi:hypothetical protein